MPRRRTISCDHCGYLQLKRDATCDRCGELTRREQHRWIVNVAYAVFVLLVVAIAYAKMKDTILGIG